jgi:hypothetical protein
MTFELNLEGGAEVLKEMCAPHIKALAEGIAATAGEDAKVYHRVTDRAAASVVVPAEQQARDGVLTRALSEAGIEISPHKERPQKTRARAQRKARPK